MLSCAKKEDWSQALFPLLPLQSRMPVYIAHTPAGTSVKNVVHFAQVGWCCADRRTDVQICMHMWPHACMHACTYTHLEYMHTCTHTSLVAHMSMDKGTMLMNLMHTSMLSLSCCTFSALEYSIFMCTKVRGKGVFSIWSLPWRIHIAQCSRIAFTGTFSICCKKLR